MEVDKTARKRTRNATSKKSKKRKVDEEEPLPPTPVDTIEDEGAIACTAASSKKNKNGGKATSRKQESPTEDEAPTPKLVKRNRINVLKPKQKSWMYHIAGNLVYQVVFQAVKSIKFDPRQHPDSVNWSFWARDVLDDDCLAKIWWYITKEYPEMSLQDILTGLEPYNRSTYHDLKVEDLKKTYEAECPKPPVTAYLLFIQEKGPKLKKDRPHLSAKEITQELAKQWSALSVSKKERYKKKYISARADYELKLQEFYDRHPEARPQRKSSRSRKLKPKDYEIKENDETSEKIRKLKKIAPKQATPPFMLFCADKRREFHTKNPDLSSTEITALLGQQWNQFTDSQKKKYMLLHEEKVKEREKSMQSFYEHYPEAKELLKTRVRTKKKIPKSDYEVPDEPATTNGQVINPSTAKSTKSTRVEDKIKLQTAKLNTIYMQQDQTTPSTQHDTTDDEDDSGEDESGEDDSGEGDSGEGDSGEEEDVENDNKKSEDEDEEESEESEEESDEESSSSDSDSS